MNKVAQEQTDPAPAVGQVWRSRKYARMVNEIERIDGNAVVWTHGGWDDLRALRGFYECVGIATPAGRVMVGERRQTLNGPTTVHGIEGERVVCRYAGDVAGLSWPAVLVAHWPLLPPAPEPQSETEATWSPTIARDKVPGPLAKAASSAFRDPMAWDRVKIGGIEAPGTILDTMRRLSASGLSPLPPERLAEMLNIQWAKPVGRERVESDEELRARCRSTRSNPYATLADLSTLGIPPLTQDEADWLADTLGLKWAPKPDPRAEREQRRREIDAVLREDARRFPAFATARRAAVMAVEERAPDTDAGDARSILVECHAYEWHGRDGKRTPSAHAFGANAHRTELHRLAIVHYERARALP